MIVQQLSDFVRAQITTMRVTNKTEPASFIHPLGLDDERVIIRPFQRALWLWNDADLATGRKVKAAQPNDEHAGSDARISTTNDGEDAQKRLGVIR